jgi:hypothetical protein
MSRCRWSNEGGNLIQLSAKWRGLADLAKSTDRGRTAGEGQHAYGMTGCCPDWQAGVCVCEGVSTIDSWKAQLAAAPVLCHLSHASSPFYSGYFWEFLFMPKLTWTTILFCASCCSCNGRYVLPCPAICWDGGLVNYWPGLALNSNPSALSLPGS